MNRISIGCSRKKKSEEVGKEYISRAAEIMTTAGIGAMAAVLIACMLPAVGTDNPSDMNDAVYVMSTSVTARNETREELVMPEKTASADIEESVFDVIGEFFASMIFGEG